MGRATLISGWGRKKYTQITETSCGPMLVDQDNMLLSRRDAIEYLQQILNSYDKKEIDEMLEESNKVQRVYNSGFEFDGKGRYFRYGWSVYEQKKFRKSRKRDWSFKCSWCQQKVISQDEAVYYLVKGNNTPIDYQRTCSEACVQLLWDEWLKGWLKENNLDTPEILKIAGYNI